MPAGTKLRPYWRRCLSDLHGKYSGVCAYLCIFIEKPLRAHSADHFVAKSKAIEHAYKWSNYRFACLGMNSRKCDFDDVLDPFMIADGTFYINFFDGSIVPNPALQPDLQQKAQDTIDRLGLDDVDCRQMRAEHYDDYRLRGVPLDHLARKSPFVWREIQRQKL